MPFVPARQIPMPPKFRRLNLISLFDLERPYLWDLATNLPDNNHLWIEVGVQTASGARFFCGAMETAYGNDWRWLGIDILDRGIWARRMIQPYIDTGHAVLLEADSQAIRFMGKAGLVFIDACHCRDCVREDTLAFAPHVAPGGWLVWHDINPFYHGKKTAHMNGDGKSRKLGVLSGIEDAMPSLGDFEFIEDIVDTTGRETSWRGLKIMRRRVTVPGPSDIGKA